MARWAPILLLAAMGLTAWGQSPSQDRYALTPAQVARALSASGMQASAAQVSLSTRVVATERDPVLDVVSVQPLGKDRSAQRVRLACHAQGQCLPFYAWVSGESGSVSIRPSTGGSEYTMRAGAHATLMMDDARAHIQVKVISLENGNAGKRIRVSSLDHKQIYFGEVVSASLLKGSF